MSLLDDLARCANVQGVHCCSWHCGIGFICKCANDMRSWRTCKKLSADAGWQCRACSAVNVIDGESTDACWLCYVGRDAALEAV